MNSPNQHWNNFFANKDDAQLSWYEADVGQTLKFLDMIPANKESSFFLPGAGTSLLVDELLSREYTLILNDVSDTALGKLKSRIGDLDNLTWLLHDMSQKLPQELAAVDIWIDRAVLHFLLDEEQIQGYFDNLRALLRPGGYVLLAEFAPDGTPKCAGLELHRYSIEEMGDRLGKDFELVRHENYIFVSPTGDDRAYVYGLFKRMVGSG